MTQDNINVNVNGGYITESVLGKGKVNIFNSNLSEFKKASSLIDKNPSLDDQTVEKLLEFLSKAEEATKKNDKTQKKTIKNNFWQFLDTLGEKAKIVETIIKEFAFVLTFFGQKPN